jgi:hypothetical protein
MQLEKKLMDCPQLPEDEQADYMAEVLTKEVSFRFFLCV